MTLEKWQCHECEKGWLMLREDTEENEIKCPFCGTHGEHVEAVAMEGDEYDYENEMGCLWPGYNVFDKLGWSIRRERREKLDKNHTSAR